MSEDIWNNKTALIKGFWGWSPEKWAAIGFNDQRRETLISSTTDPFIMAIYVTQSSPRKNPDIQGKIVGFYLVSHEKGDRNEFIDPEYHSMNPEKWRCALKAVRAFSFLPEYRPNVYEFDPSLKNGAQGKASRGVILSAEQIENLKSLPYIEVPLYNSDTGEASSEDIKMSVPSKGKVKAGPVNRSGYSVEGEPLNTEKELYALKLEGGTSSFLDESMGNYNIYKIGLSISPKTRLASFQNALPYTCPKGKIEWRLHRSTRQDGHVPYPNFESALKGEEAMKEFLAKNGKWLGGEFYATTNEQFEQAWRIGREAALNNNSE